MNICKFMHMNIKISLIDIKTCTIQRCIINDACNIIYYVVKQLFGDPHEGL